MPAKLWVHHGSSPWGNRGLDEIITPIALVVFLELVGGYHLVVSKFLGMLVIFGPRAFPLLPAQMEGGAGGVTRYPMAFRRGRALPSFVWASLPRFAVCRDRVVVESRRRTDSAIRWRASRSMVALPAKPSFFRRPPDLVKSRDCGPENASAFFSFSPLFPGEASWMIPRAIIGGALRS